MTETTNTHQHRIMKMANLPSKQTLTTWFLFFLMNDILHHSSSARTLGNTTPTNQNHDSHHPNHHHHHQNITFFMKDVFNTINTTQHHSSSRPSAASQVPFQKPLGLFPPTGGIPLPQSVDQSTPIAGLATQTVEVSNVNVVFPVRATLEELELGALMMIDEDLFEDEVDNYGSNVIGKAQGVYVVNSENEINNHMMAMVTHFVDGEFKDGLRFFGVIRNDGVDIESHVAVIGGMSKYDGANGYATIKFVKNKSLLFNVYLS